MADMSRKYWVLAIVVVLIIGGSYVAVWITESIATKHRERRPAPQYQYRMK